MTRRRLGDSDTVRGKPSLSALDKAIFAVVSFEGPDPYSQAGGLGVRVSGLVQTLADLDFETHLFFIGDPALRGEQRDEWRPLVLHRWAQWISANCPRGVYDGEAGKVADLNASLPPYLLQQLLIPAIQAGRLPVVLLEEWQTADCACRISDALRALGLRDRVAILWNANNPYGFDRIDWPRLASAAVITTISRHMRSIMRSCGVDARVVPNGIPDASFDRPPRGQIARLRNAIDETVTGGLLFKMARWEHEKGWVQSLDAIAHARASDAGELAPVLIARSGGPSRHGAGLVPAAGIRGLKVTSFDSEEGFLAHLSDSVRSGVNVVNLRFGVSAKLARTLYVAADAVLANSISEPFGLVGLEAMAAGGVAFTGGTGEDYAVDGRNAVVLQTLDPAEIISRWRGLQSAPALERRLRRAARQTAREYRWQRVAGLLLTLIAREIRANQMLDSASDPMSDKLPVPLHLACDRQVPLAPPLQCDARASDARRGALEPARALA